MRAHLFLVCVAGCIPRAVTLPARAFVMDSPATPAVGAFDLQVDGATMGAPWGPELMGGDARVRHTVAPGVSLEADAGVLHVGNTGFPDDRNGYTGRLGVLLYSQGRRAAIGAGLGGGTSHTAGTWATADVHGMLSGGHRYVRPMVGAGLGYGEPFGRRMFTVTDIGGSFAVGDTPPSPDTATLRLPRNACAELQVGVELGPPDRALILGASLMGFWRFEPSWMDAPRPNEDTTDLFATLGAGVRIAL